MLGHKNFMLEELDSSKTDIDRTLAAHSLATAFLDEFGRKVVQSLSR